MPYYQINFRRDQGFLKKYRSETDIEATDSAEAVRLFMTEYNAEADFNPETVAKVLGSRWRLLKFYVPEGGNVQVLSVKEVDEVQCDVCVGNKTYAGTAEICFACQGKGRIEPALSKRLNNYLRKESEIRGVAELRGEAWFQRTRKIMDELQAGLRTLPDD